MTAAALAQHLPVEPAHAADLREAPRTRALTASDRPYKLGKTLSESLTILGRMKLEHHVDPDLFDVFLRERVYLEYAHRFLAPEQIDAIDWTRIPGVSAELAAELAAMDARG